jgi:hypothetical protein
MCKCNHSSIHSDMPKRCACTEKGVICCSKQLSTNPTQPYDRSFNERLEAHLEAFLDMVRRDYANVYKVPMSTVGFREVGNIVTSKIREYIR